MTMRKVWKRGRRSRRGGREEEEEDKKSGGKGERKKQKRGENEERRAKASRGNRPLRLFSGRRKPPLLVFYVKGYCKLSPWLQDSIRDGLSLGTFAT